MAWLAPRGKTLPPQGCYLCGGARRWLDSRWLFTVPTSRALFAMCPTCDSPSGPQAGPGAWMARLNG